MNTKEFDLANYNTGQVTNIIQKKLNEQLVLPEVKGYNISSNLRINFSFPFSATAKELLEVLDDKWAKIVEEELRANHELSIEKAKKDYALVSEEAKAVLHDDKDYQKLLEEIPELYYCQATTLLRDMLHRKTTRASAKAQSYRARQMIYNKSLSCL